MEHHANTSNMKTIGSMFLLTTVGVSASYVDYMDTVEATLRISSILLTMTFTVILFIRKSRQK